MTDKQILKEMLTRSGIVFKEEDCFITVEEGAGPKNKGYSCFCSQFEFDGNGKLLTIGAYE